MSGRTGLVWVGVVLWLGFFPCELRAAHPLDALTAEEIERAITQLRGAGRADGRTRFPWVTLEAPEKTTILAWQAGRRPAPARRARVLVKRADRFFEAVVSLDAPALESWREIRDAQPPMLLTEEWQMVERLVRTDRAWREAMRRRGIEDLARVVTVPVSAGGFQDDDAGGGRRLRVLAFHGGGGRNFWRRPIEGVVALFDPDRRRVLRVIDTGVVPIPRGGPDPEMLDSAAADPTGGDPAEHGIRFEAGEVFWRNWRFHARLDPREGPVVSLVRHRDGGVWRSVLHEGHLSELFVPYMDPTPAWSFRSHLDAGEYGLGRLAVSLVPGRDAPANALYRDAVFTDDWGEPYVVPRAACLFERRTGNAAWRHTDAAGGWVAVAAATEIVYRAATAVGNYDYVLDWIFRTDGSIRVEVAATGVPLVRAIPPAGEPAEGSGSGRGRRVAADALGVHHDHWFSYRLDLDVDGVPNRFRADRLNPVRYAGGGGRTEGWTLAPFEPEREGEARLTIDLARPALWRVVNPSRRNRSGEAASYRLVPGRNARLLSGDDDPLRRRAGFVNAHLWVTPRAEGERHAAGRYPNQRARGDGLPRWTERDRPIRDTDLVLWYTLGFHHAVRAEDFPVQPAMRLGFDLVPFDFFDRNPAVRTAE